jgi:hypothetical protein
VKQKAGENLTLRLTLRGWIILLLAPLAVAVIVTMYAVAPTLRRVARVRTETYLSERFKSTVEFTGFQVSLYPRIHIVINGLVMRHRGRTDIPPLIQISALAMDANFTSLLSSHPIVSQVTLGGLRINTPPREAGDKPLIQATDADLSRKFPVTIVHTTADQAMITILRRDGKRPKQFEIHRLEMNNFNFTNAAFFHALLTNPVPRGEILCEGQFGPWQANDPSQTPVTAKYMFSNADLGTLKGLRGTLSSEGRFSGPLDYLKVEGRTEVPDFALRTSDHPIALHTDFQAIVDGTNGNTYLNLVTSKFAHTTLVTKGEVVDRYPNVKGRTIVMDTTSNSGRVEDLLLLAVKANPPVMNGSAKLKAKILIPEGNSDLIERLRIDGQFGVAEAEFASDATQQKINSLSRRSQGKPRDVDLTAVSELQGAFKVDKGDVTFSRLGFSIPGAEIALAGSYSIDSGQLDFRGKLTMQAKLSQTVTGVKSFFLKAVDPFFKDKNGKGSVLPIKITGTKDHPSFGLDRSGRLF